jgi:acetylornithine deacetylase/succinyl-diaminopimelate desuccinylase-like protein
MSARAERLRRTLPSRCLARALGGVSAAFLVMAGLPAGAQDDAAGASVLTRRTDPNEQRALEIYRELIEIDTTHGNGSTTTAAEAMAARLIAAGFPAADVQVLAELPRKGNLVARYRGRGDGAEALLLLAHLDVVEADPADWTVPPFVLLERDGYYYGRGTLDDKDEAAIHVANFIRLREEGFVPDRDIIVALTADEEGGPDNGVEWLLGQHRDAIDAGLALNEGGGGAIRGGRRISNNVQTSEKVFQSYVLEVLNPGGHSSRPERDNAIYRLAGALTRLAAFEFPIELNDTTRRFFELTAADVEPGLAAAMRGIVRTPPEPAAVAALTGLSLYNALLRTTCVATMLDAGHAENALPQRARATVNCRIMPGGSPDDVQATLARVVADDGVSISPLDVARPSAPSPLAEAVIGPIERITAELWPSVRVIPTMSTGATDSLYLRNAGIPAYGVSGIFVDVDDNRAHGRDERILVESFYEGLEFLYRLTRELAQTTHD